MPSVREQIRNFIDSQSSPPLAGDIVAALKAAGIKLRYGAIGAMVTDGALTVTGEPGHYRYSVGRRPAPPVVPGQRQKEYEAMRSERRRAERQAAGRKSRNRTKVQPVVRRPLEPQPAPLGAHQSVEDYIAAGGRIEVLPGIQKSNVYQQRRPVTRFAGRVSA